MTFSSSIRNSFVIPISGTVCSFLSHHGLFSFSIVYLIHLAVFCNNFSFLKVLVDEGQSPELKTAVFHSLLCYYPHLFLLEGNYTTSCGCI